MSRRGDSPAAESLRELLGGAASALKVFPLPGGIVFPGTPAPFHIFEPRYRAMVEDALRGDRVLAVAALRSADDAPMARAPVHRIAGAGFIEADEKLVDGRYTIMLRGVARVRLLEEILGTPKPYREFKAEILDDLYPPGGQAELSSEVEALEQVVLELARRLPSETGAPELAEAVARMRIPARMADLVAAAVVNDDRARLRILEAIEVKERMAIVIREVAALLLQVPGKGGARTPSA